MQSRPIDNIAFGAPIPGQSLTDTPKQAPHEHPPQFVDMKEAMNYLMNQMTEAQNQHQMLQLMEGGMPIEAIVRTLLFTGFATGKWTVDIALLLYKPLMLALISMANRAGLKDTLVLMPEAVNKQMTQKLNMFQMVNAAKDQNKPQEQAAPIMQPTATNTTGGFMNRGV